MAFKTKLKNRVFRQLCGTQSRILFNIPSLEATFVLTYSTWTVQLKVSSIITPKHLHEFTFTIGLSAMLTLRSVFETLCLDPMSMDLVLLAFIICLFLTDQLWILARAIFKIYILYFIDTGGTTSYYHLHTWTNCSLGGYKVEDH